MNRANQFSKNDIIEHLTNFFSADLILCNKIISERMTSPVSLVPILASHLITAGGKRLRPLLTIASARLCGCRPAPEESRHALLGACIEFIHTATLLHDDVVDDSNLRRGKASANAIFGNQASVLVGDFLFSRAFELMVEDGSAEVLAIISKATTSVSEGEVLQLITQNDLSTTKERYFDVIIGKTASLFAAACETGAVLTDRPAEERQALAAYGLNLGIAFQLTDDALDYNSDRKELGKNIGDDFREGKITLPILIAYQKGSEKERQFWHKTIENLHQSDTDLTEALCLLSEHQAITETLECARNFACKAQGNLAIFPDSYIKKAMQQLADYAVNRLH